MKASLAARIESNRSAPSMCTPQRGDDWFGERMMNGMNRGTFQPDPKKKGHYWIHYFGKCWYDSNEVYALPDVDILFKLKKNGLPEPYLITSTETSSEATLSTYSLKRRKILSGSASASSQTAFGVTA